MLPTCFVNEDISLQKNNWGNKEKNNLLLHEIFNHITENWFTFWTGVAISNLEKWYNFVL